MSIHISDELEQTHPETIAFLAFSGAATALAGIAGLTAAGAGVI
ncbi:hypothetical protein [Natronoarchaeum rubrum]|nr:hypothetical protein [Natronoarchaeum rubrum]